MNIEARVHKALAEGMGIDADQIANDQHLIDDLGMDSIDAIDICMAVEDEFDLEIPDDDTEKINTVQDIVNYVTARMNVGVSRHD